MSNFSAREWETSLTDLHVEDKCEHAGLAVCQDAEMLCWVMNFA